MGKRSELVDKLVEHVPKPLDRQVEGNRTFRVEEVVEKLANVFIGLESVVNGRLEPGIDVSEIKLSVKSQEYLIVANKRCDELSLGPFVVKIMSLSELVPSRLVHAGDGGQIVLQNGLVEHDQEPLHILRNELQSGELLHLLLLGHGGLLGVGMLLELLEAPVFIAFGKGLICLDGDSELREKFVLFRFVESELMWRTIDLLHFHSHGASYFAYA